MLYTYYMHAWPPKQTNGVNYKWWLSTLLSILSFFIYQVVIRGELSADSEASEVLAIDDLSFSPCCGAVSGTGTINNIAPHRQHKFTPWHFEISPHINRPPQTCFEYRYQGGRVRDEFDAVQYLDRERSIKHCPVGILDIIWTCCFHIILYSCEPKA